MGVSDKYVSILAHLRAFEGWLSDPSVNEVAVNAPGVVQLWKRGVWEQVEAPVITFEYLQALGNFLAKNLSRQSWRVDKPRK